MATKTGTRQVGTTSPDIEEIVPNSGWTQDHSAHFLLLDLPDFKKEEVNLQVDASTGLIIVKGERQTSEQKRVHFELTFPVPSHSDMDKISAKFDSEILHVCVPVTTSSQEHRESNEIDRTWGGERRNGDNYYSQKLGSMSRAIVGHFMSNKGVVVAAVLAFSFGLYVTHKFHFHGMHHHHT